MSVLLSNASSQPTHISINKNAAILPQVPPSALNHTPCSPVRREILSHDGQLCSSVQCCVCVWSGLWLSLSLSAGSDLWWWMRHVISPHSLVFHEQGSVRIPVLSGPPFYTNTCFPCLHKDSWEKSHVDTMERSHTKRCVWGAFNCDW